MTRNYVPVDAREMRWTCPGCDASGSTVHHTLDGKVVGRPGDTLAHEEHQRQSPHCKGHELRYSLLRRYAKSWPLKPGVAFGDVLDPEPPA